MTIGDKVYLAPLVQILAVNHVFSDPTRPIIEQGITAEGIVVEDNVWIGAGAIITDGVRIDQGVVIGAGAVVMRDVPPHTVAVGAPGQILDFSQEPERSGYVEVGSQYWSPASKLDKELA